ncbi:uncharacterized protein [Physcomitrium patens]|uniref:Uncharacterized protein n=1 Tax=Physcomitrium patens TaxID=3218 RepID=A9TIQ4_PHYPA|nr:uncharacterized protein C3orf26 homolog [Physcomitrium patens]PNR52703.1 hypothetical protein PHYPA_009078 [Physcomitrium patens]|eukprot:XP_024378112.1 uncharacterized protein C3orf26 homolog [Physcomitrella patens]
MPAVMERNRKKNSRSGTVVADEKLGPAKKVFKTRPLTKKKAQAKANLKASSDGDKQGSEVAVVDKSGVQWRPRTEQTEWFTATFHSVFGALLSAAEKEPIPDDRIVELTEEIDRSTEKLGSHVKRVIGPIWKESLCTVDKDGDAGSPVVLVLCSSAIRCVELLRGMKAFIGKVKPAKLFAKHIKVDEQVALLKEHVNIAAGTPNRVRKLIDIGALGTSCLRLIILDMHADAKGLTILSVPQVMAEFWEFYRAHLHQLFLTKQTQLMLY